MTRIGCLFSGYGGLSDAVQSVYGGTLAWYSEFDPAPSKIMDHHHPGIPNLGDITQVDWKEVAKEAPVDILTGGFPCFAAGTPVLTRRGLVGIETVREGDDVWTHQGRWRKVTATMSREAETVEFRPGFYSTPEHRLWMREPSMVWRNEIRRYRRILSDPTWVTASASQGRFMATPIDLPGEPYDKPERLSWWQVGRWLADGFCGNGVHVYVGHQKRSDLEQLAGWTVSERRTALRTTMPASRGEADWLTEHFGAMAHGKTLPSFAFGLDREDRERLLEGYWSGDGYAFGETAMRSASVSPFLTVGISMLAASLGYTISTHYNRTSPTTVIEGRTVNQRDWWSVTATPDDGRFAFRDDRWLWHKQRRAPKEAGRRTVFDLTVEEDHSFVAAGIVVHNCQDVSVAGRRAGMTDGTRSGLWSHMAAAIDILRPELVVIENVGGLFSAQADRVMESHPLCLGDDGGGSNTVLLRAIDAVLGELSSVGYDTEWTALRASDVGAPHGRLRVFITAHPQDTGAGRSGGWSPLTLSGGEGGADAPSHGPNPGLGTSGGAPRLMPTPVSQPSGNTPEEHLRKKPGREVVTDLSIIAENGLWETGGRLLPTPGANLGENGGPQHPDKRRAGGHSVSIEDAVHALIPTPSVADAMGGHERRGGARGDELLLKGLAKEGHLSRFGLYAPAISRWEQVLGRPAPDPTEPGKTRPRLSARFVEWLMGLPDGHVTAVPGLTRNQQLKALGNGVVPAQASAALTYLHHIRTTLGAQQ